MLIFSSAFNGFDRVWYQNLACHLSILFMSKLTCSSALVANNTIRKFIDWYYRAADHSARQLFRTQKKIHISTTFRQKHQKTKRNWKSTYEHCILRLNCSVTQELWLAKWSKSVIFQFVRDKRATDHCFSYAIYCKCNGYQLRLLLR